MDILRPGYDRVKDEPDRSKQLLMLEKEAVLVSLENLMTFPFIREAVENDMLALHGLWTEIGDGELEYFDAKASSFLPV